MKHKGRTTEVGSIGRVVNLSLDITVLTNLNGNSSVPQSTMDSIGLTSSVLTNMYNGQYNKVLDSSATYPSAWEYTAYKPNTTTEKVYLVRGAGTTEATSFILTKNTNMWSVVKK